MKYLVWFFRLILFVALFGLAVKNSSSVDLRFYFGQHFDAPLSLIVLGVFAMGVAVGVSVSMLTLLRQRRELNRLRPDTQLNKKA